MDGETQVPFEFDGIPASIKEALIKISVWCDDHGYEHFLYIEDPEEEEVEGEYDENGELVEAKDIFVLYNTPLEVIIEFVESELEEWAEDADEDEY